MKNWCVRAEGADSVRNITYLPLSLPASFQPPHYSSEAIHSMDPLASARPIAFFLPVDPYRLCPTKI